VRKRAVTGKILKKCGAMRLRSLDAEGGVPVHSRPAARGPRDHPIGRLAAVAKSAQVAAIG